MRIGIMLRHYDQHGGGVKVYTRALLRHLLECGSSHEYVFFYKAASSAGDFSGQRQVHEVVVPGRSTFLWDQVSLPRAVRKLGIDVLFNPKYSIPLTVSCPTAWVCHGLDWYVMPWASKWVDRLSHRYLVPLYAAKADAIIAVSKNTREHVIQYLKVPPTRVHTVYTGIEDEFRSTLDSQRLASIRRQYQLPERYLLYAGAIYPPKNFTRLIRAYARVGPALGLPLVIAGGENRFLSESELREPERLGLGAWVRWTGWVDNATLPAFYQMAKALLLPSLFESFGLPIVEAMASGCPVVTSDRYGSKEVAADAAVLVNPESVESIAAGIQRATLEGGARMQLIERGRERAQQFTWDRCARQTLAVLEGIAKK
jgi:O-antigen biosynthesis alpha-1,2-mannosyltransferase